MRKLRAVLLVVLLALVSIPALAQDKKSLTILYTNDIHAHFDPHIVPWISKTRKVGGFANLATLVKKEKASNNHTVFFDAGDFFSGPYVSSLTKGEAIIDAMNYLDIDAAAVGNHEFDHGLSRLGVRRERLTTSFRMDFPSQLRYVLLVKGALMKFNAAFVFR